MYHLLTAIDYALAALGTLVCLGMWFAFVFGGAKVEDVGTQEQTTKYFMRPSKSRRTISIRRGPGVGNCTLEAQEGPNNSSRLRCHFGKWSSGDHAGSLTIRQPNDHIGRAMTTRINWPGITPFAHPEVAFLAANRHSGNLRSRGDQMHHINCPHCQRRINVAPKYSGRNVRCPGCQHPFTCPVIGDVQMPAPVQPTPPLATQAPPSFTPQQTAHSPVLVVAAPQSQPRLNSGGWFVRSFASTTGILLALLAFFAIGTLTVCGGVMYLMSSAVEQAERIEAESRPKVRPSSPPASHDFSPEPRPTTAPTPPPQPEVTAFPQVLGFGDIEVTPASASVEIIPLKVIGGTSQSAEPHFLLQFTVRNLSQVKRIAFRGWPEQYSSRSNCTLTDEHGNNYKVVSFGLGSSVQGDGAGKTIEPGGSVESRIAFEKPIAAANELTVELDGDAVGLPNSQFKWRIDRSQWEGKESASSP